MRADALRGKRRVEIRTPDGFLFGQAGPEKDGKAADEGVAGASGVYRTYAERRDHFAALDRGEERPAAAKRENHFLKALLEEGGGTFFGFVDRMHRKAGDQ